MAVLDRQRPYWCCVVFVAAHVLLSCIDGAAADAGTDQVIARDHYEVLRLTREASQAEIKRAHKKMALQYHPDKNREKDAGNMFIEIQKAYEVLGDPERRRKYDQRSKFFSEEAPDDAPSGEEGTANAPDGGRGTAFDTVEEIREAVSGTRLCVIHVYSDQGHMFGGWMEQLPPEFRLGHVNIGRNPLFNKALLEMHGGSFGSVPLLMVCHQSKCRSFRPSMGGFFFNPFQSVVSSVVEEALPLVDYWEHVTRLRSDGGLQSFCDFSPGNSAKLRVIFIVEDADELYWSLFSAASHMHKVAHFAQLRYFDAADMHGYPHAFMSRFGVTSLPAAVFLDPVSGVHATVSGRRASDSVASIPKKLFHGERVSSNLFIIPELDAASHLARCEHGGCEWLVLLATSSSFEATSEFTHAWGSFTLACQSLHALRAQLPGTPVCFWLRLGRTSAWSSILEAAGVRHGAAVTAAVLDGRHLAVSPEGTTSNHRMLFRWITNAISGRAESQALAKSEWPPFPPSLERRMSLQESVQARFNKMQAPLAGLWRHAAAAYAPVVNWFLGWAGADPLTALGIVLLVGSLATLAWSWVMEEETEPSIKDVLQDMQFQVTCSLHRKDEQSQLGFGLAGHKDGGLAICSVAPGGSLDTWFANCGGRPERQVQEGDRILCVSFPDTRKGKFAHAHCPQAMARALKEARDVTLTITPSAARLEGLQLLMGLVQLDGLTLKSSVTLAYGSRPDGFRHDLEVVHLGPAMAAWNAQRRCEGACCSQSLELGDRVVAVGRHTHVVEHLEVTSPEVLVAKWRPAGTISMLQMEVTLERANPEDNWGMHLRKFCDAKGALYVVVQKIIPGKLADHNAQLINGCCDHRPVLTGDRLVAVNGFTDSQQMSVELKRSKVALRFQRWLETMPSEAKLPVEASHCTSETSQSVAANSDAGASKKGEDRTQVSAVHRDGFGAGMECVEEAGWDIELEAIACDEIGSDVQTQVRDAGECTTSTNTASASTPQESTDATGCPEDDACLHQRAALAARRQQAPQKTTEQVAHAPAVQVEVPPFEGLDENGAWMNSSTLCVIAARGSPLYLSTVLALRDALLPMEQVKFYCEQRLPLASVLVAMPTESRCRWFNLPSLEPQEGHSHNEALSATVARIEKLVQHVLCGDTGLLPICFDPADFASRNFGACLVSPADATSDQKLD